MKHIECQCGRLIGVRNSDGSISVKYHRREVEFWPPARIRCHGCHFTTAIDKEPEPVVQ